MTKQMAQILKTLQSVHTILILNDKQSVKNKVLIRSSQPSEVN